MPTAHATVATARPSRYLQQLCRHVDQLRQHLHRHRPRAGDPTHVPPGTQARVTWTETAGMIDLGWGRCTLRVADGALVLHATAHDAADLRRLQALLSARLQQIGRRDHLSVDWEPGTTPASPPAIDRPPGTIGAARRGTRRRTLALVAVGVLAVALHLALGAAAIESAPWAGPALDIVLVAVVVKLLASIVLGRRIVHHHRRHPPPAAIESAPWAGPALDIVLVAVVVKLLASIVLGRRIVHHHHHHRRRPPPAAPTEPTTPSEASE